MSDLNGSNGHEVRSAEEGDTRFDDSSIDTVSPNNVKRFAPYMNSLRTVLLELSKKYKLGFEKRTALRQKLLDWLETRLEAFPHYELALAQMGFNCWGEQFAKEMVESLDLLPDEDLEIETVQIIDDTNGRITEL